MDNPFAPGAGTPPPELAGRDHIITSASVVLRRIRKGRPAKGQLLLGLRGVGKTVLLNHLSEMADAEGFEVSAFEAPEGGRLVDLLVPRLRGVLVRLSRVEKAKEVGTRALGVLRAFAGAFKVSVGDIEFGVAPASGQADSGRLELDLPDLLVEVGRTARAADKGVALLIDEVQYLNAEDLGGLIVAVHAVTQKGLPLVLFGAGLPQLAGLAGEAKSYAERLFDYPDVGSLPDEEARKAIERPIDEEGVIIEREAVDELVATTQGYPYFLQEWGYRTWNAASRSPITGSDVRVATEQAIRALDESFFRVRFDRLTPREKEYLRAMADLGQGPHRSGDIAGKLGIAVTAAGPLRTGLIRKGMIYSPQHGDTAFTVPMFDDFLRRTMPDWTPSKTPQGRRARPKTPG